MGGASFLAWGICFDGNGVTKNIVTESTRMVVVYLVEGNLEKSTVLKINSKTGRSARS